MHDVERAMSRERGHAGRMDRVVAAQHPIDRRDVHVVATHRSTARRDVHMVAAEHLRGQRAGDD